MVTLKNGKLGGTKARWHCMRTTLTGKLSVYISCPMCGKIGRLTDHVVDKNGNVSPSVVCVREGCQWHANINLQDWKGESA